MILGIDVGGANTKVASSDGKFVESVYLPLWRRRDELRQTLLKLRTAAEGRLGEKVEAVGVVMTGELCDCFRTKREGVRYIESVVRSAFPEALFFDKDGCFRNVSTGDELSFASTNWLASAMLVRSMFGETLFVDVGSTTTDIIPVKADTSWKPDLERLRAGELIYSGVLRTSVASILREVRLRGRRYKIAAELFAVTADVYLLLGDLRRADYTCECPDGYAYVDDDEAKSEIAALRRLARLLCCDLEELGREEILEVARQVKEAQLNELVENMRRLSRRFRLRTVVSAGVGEFLVADAARRLNLEHTAASEVFGEKVSRVLPAYATARLLENSL